MRKKGESSKGGKAVKIGALLQWGKGRGKEIRGGKSNELGVGKESAGEKTGSDKQLPEKDD